MVSDTWSIFLNNLKILGFLSFTKAIIIFLVGLVFAKICSRSIHTIAKKYVSSQHIMLIKKGVYFALLTLFAVAALQELGFKLSVLLGSAGIATAAIAFASQTSISNIISGVFLILEKSFQVGDQIKMGSTLGTIESIDLLSMKILTADNTVVRVPNETVIKSEIVNITRYRKRRLLIPINISYEDDIHHMKQVLLNIAQSQPQVLQEPAPSVVIDALAKSSIVIHLSVWVEQEQLNILKEKLYEEIKDQLFVPKKQNKKTHLLNQNLQL